MKKTQISIIVPVYNAEKYLPKCLDSLINQTFKDIEILCINDGSTDGSLNILNEYAAKDNRVKVFSQANAGPAKARNVGLENAKGEYIMFCDADDTYEPICCEKMIAHIEKHNVDFVMCHINTYNKSCELTNSEMWFPFQDGKRKLTYQDKLKTNVYVWNKIFKKSIIDKYHINFPNGHKSDDNSFVYKYCAVSNQAYYLAKKLYNHYDCANSIMNQFFSENIKLEDLTDKPFIIGEVYNFILSNGILQKERKFFSELVCLELEKTWKNVPVIWENDFLEVFSEIFSNIPEEDIDFDDKIFFKLYKLLLNKKYRPVAKVLDSIIRKNNNYRRKYSVQEKLKPAFSTNNIPIVFNTDSDYVKYTSVAIQSILENSTQKNNYDIVILTENISEEGQNIIQNSIKDIHNFSIRFYNMENYCKKYSVDKFQTVGYVRKAAYYRLFISEIFKEYSKIIYLDSDLILKADIADLLRENLNEKAIGAVSDFYISNVSPTNEFQLFGICEYGKNILNITNWEKYFNSGVLVFDIQKIISKNYQESFIKIAKINNRFFNDQNVLNSVLQDDVCLLDKKWNMQINGGGSYYLANILPLEQTKILHFCSNIKPWTNPKSAMASFWWSYARMSPFYEEILFQNIKQSLFKSETPAIFKEMLGDIFNYTKNKHKYWKYKLLSKITFGKKRKKYKQKKKDLKQRLKAVRSFLKVK